MSKLSVSVIVPVFNGTRYLKSALHSVLTQTHPPDEILVIDDGSSDNPECLLKEFGSKIRFYRQSNKGPASARNTGIERSRGEMLAFIDQDDCWHPEKLHRQLDCFLEHRELEVCFSHVDLFWENEVSAEAVVYANHPRSRCVPGYIAPTLLARRSLFETVGMFNPSLKFGDGTEWAMRVIDSGRRFYLHPDVLLYHRMHEANLTRQREASKSEFVRIIRERLVRNRAKTSDTLKCTD